MNDFAGRDSFDSRDVQDRIDELEALEPDDDPDAEAMDPDEAEELTELRTLSDDAGTSEWCDGITFIRDDTFEDYARELAEDIGAVSDDAAWPCTCIDWEQAARELQSDYSSVSFGGYDYFYQY